MRYTTPDLAGNTIAYEGRRYWAVKLSEGGAFQCVDTSIADFVVFDRLDDAPIGQIKSLPEGGFEVSTIMGLEGPDYAQDLREAVRLAVKLCDRECKAVL